MLVGVDARCDWEKKCNGDVVVQNVTDCDTLEKDACREVMGLLMGVGVTGGKVDVVTQDVRSIIDDVDEMEVVAIGLLFPLLVGVGATYVREEIADVVAQGVTSTSGSDTAEEFICVEVIQLLRALWVVTSAAMDVDVSNKIEEEKLEM